MRLILTMSSTPASAKTIKRYYRVDRREIAFIKFIFEAYDGIAVLETLEPAAGMVVFHIAPGCEPDADTLLQDLKRDIMIEPVGVTNELVNSKFSSTL